MCLHSTSGTKLDIFPDTYHSTSQAPVKALNPESEKLAESADGRGIPLPPFL